MAKVVILGAGVIGSATYLERSRRGRPVYYLPVITVGGHRITGELAEKRDTSIVVAGEDRPFSTA
jgi:glycine/D-amino acid oxidase-like deaminating enzyme